MSIVLFVMSSLIADRPSPLGDFFQVIAVVGRLHSLATFQRASSRLRERSTRTSLDAHGVADAEQVRHILKRNRLTATAAAGRDACCGHWDWRQNDVTGITRRRSIYSSGDAAAVQRAGLAKQGRTQSNTE